MFGKKRSAALTIALALTTAGSLLPAGPARAETAAQSSSADPANFLGASGSNADRLPPGAPPPPVAGAVGAIGARVATVGDRLGATGGCAVLLAQSLASPPAPLCFPAGVLPIGSSGPAGPPQSTCVPIPLANDKCPAWVATYDGSGGSDAPGEGLLNSRVMATSPDGQVVYVAAVSDGDPSSGRDYDYALIAFDAATGAQRWVTRYEGPPALRQAAPFALAVSSTGTAVFVTGTVYSDNGSTAGIATVAVSAATGTQLWVTLFLEPNSEGLDATTSPNGSRVYVTGRVWAPSNLLLRQEAITLAYDAASGQQLWLARYPGDPGDRTLAFRIAANPDGSRLYVAAGKVNAAGYTFDVVLLVYDPVSGVLLRDTHHPTKGFPPAGIAVSRDGSKVFIEEANVETTNLNNALTLAYDSAGTKLWTARFTNTCDNFKCSARPWYYGPIAASPDGSQVFVTTLAFDPPAVTVFKTVAYDAGTGAEQWVAAYEGNVLDCFCGPVVDVNPKGEEVYITGLIHQVLATRHTATLAYEPATGAQRWAAIYRNESGDTGSNAIAVSPDGSGVFVGGAQRDLAAPADLFALAYATSVAPTAVRLLGFSARPAGESVLLRWRPRRDCSASTFGVRPTPVIGPRSTARSFRPRPLPWRLARPTDSLTAGFDPESGTRAGCKR